MNDVSILKNAYNSNDFENSTFFVNTAEGDATLASLFDMEEKRVDVNYASYVMNDSVAEMKKMKDQSVNLIMTSPPYADARKDTYGGVKVDEYVEWFMPFAAEMYRILADDGSLVINIKEKVVDGERSTYLHDLIRDMRAIGWRWTEEYIWHKTNATPGKWPNRFRDSWEHLYHFTKNKKFVMNQDDVRIPIGDWSKHPSELKRKEGRDVSSTRSGFGIDRKGLAQKETVYPSNVLQGSTESSNKGHSAVYPLWIPEFFIKLFSNKDDVVFDPFIGSGSTIIASLNLGRNAIGCELLDEHKENAIKRIIKESQSEILVD